MNLKTTIITTCITIFCGQTASAQTDFFDAHLSEYGQLEQTLGERWNSIDSLTIYGTIDFADFQTMARCARDGRLKAINLQQAEVKDRRIPDYAFVYPLPTMGHILDIRRIILPDNITAFGQYAFAFLKLRKISLPSALRSMGENCFASNYLLESDPLIIPEGLTEIPANCFAGCSNLKNVTLPSTLRLIDALAFHATGLERIHFPHELDSIGPAAFQQSALTEVTLPAKAAAHLSNNVFQRCESLRRAVLPEGIGYLPDYTFSNCTALTETALPQSLTHIGKSAFSGCSALRVDLPEQVRFIEEGAFAYTASDSIVFPATVERIGDAAFRQMPNLQRIYTYATVPPACDGQPFGTGILPYNDTGLKPITLYVPTGTSDLYRTAPGWSYCSRIVETDRLSTDIHLPVGETRNPYRVYASDGCIVIQHSGSTAAAERYSVHTARGNTVAQGTISASHTLPLPPGIYIVRIGRVISKIAL